MSQFNYTVAYKPGKKNTAEDVLSRCPDYKKLSQKNIHFSDQRGLPLCTLHYFDSSILADFIEVIPGPDEGDQIGITLNHTAVHKGNTSNICSTK